MVLLTLDNPKEYPGCPVPNGKLYRMGSLAIIVSIDDGLHHLSISHPTRYPTWEEIKKARYKLLPRDRYFAQVLPPPNHYVNIHPNCFHLWELNERTITVLRDQES